ncbi:MAG TPA: hypothetical protein VNF45_00540 [Candidatus Binataceae bacterium]|nr:hypothetical protein [Candidatus Binataceae bacterium]
MGSPLIQLDFMNFGLARATAAACALAVFGCCLTHSVWTISGLPGLGAGTAILASPGSIAFLQ